MKTAQHVETSRKVAPSAAGTTRQVRVAFHEDGTTTVTGVHREHLVNIFTSAANECYRRLEKVRRKIKDPQNLTLDERDALRYWREQLAVLDALKTGQEVCVAATHQEPPCGFWVYSSGRYAEADQRLKAALEAPLF